jgi:hypothetical protein
MAGIESNILLLQEAPHPVGHAQAECAPSREKDAMHTVHKVERI